MIKLLWQTFSLEIEKPQLMILQDKDKDWLQQLLNILSGKQHQEDCEYFFQGISVKSFSQRQLSALRKKQVINISDSGFLMADYTVEKNLKLQLKYSGIYPTKAKRKIDATLEILNLSNLKDLMISDLTAFQVIQVKLVKALICEPKLICGYSPFKDLEGDEVEWVNGIIEKLVAKESIVLFVLEENT